MIGHKSPLRDNQDLILKIGKLYRVEVFPELIDRIFCEMGLNEIEAISKP